MTADYDRLLTEPAPPRCEAHGVIRPCGHCTREALDEAEEERRREKSHV